MAGAPRGQPRDSFAPAARRIEQEDFVARRDEKSAVRAQGDRADEIVHHPEVDPAGCVAIALEGGPTDVDPPERLPAPAPERTFAEKVRLVAHAGERSDFDRSGHRLQMVRPPSTGKSTPVMKLASSDAR